ncbi:hypothetical protein P692DRAFT_20850759 [Suillus brevipes Sb2]|nr:hypothetical protein P692DRAFT_20850759 [Suillus brevipes Sb2]
MTQAKCQLRDSQNQINTLHAELFDLRDRLHNIECAHNIAEMYMKTMMHEHYPDGGQSIRWITDKEFDLYDDSSAEEGSPMSKAIAGPLTCGLAAQRSLNLSHCQLAWCHLQAAKDTHTDDEPSSPIYFHVDGTPEV